MRVNYTASLWHIICPSREASASQLSCKWILYMAAISKIAVVTQRVAYQSIILGIQMDNLIKLRVHFSFQFMRTSSKNVNCGKKWDVNGKTYKICASITMQLYSIQIFFSSGLLFWEFGLLFTYCNHNSVRSTGTWLFLKIYSPRYYLSNALFPRICCI